MRLLRSYFSRNDSGFRYCEEARRGNLFVLVLIMRLLRSYFLRNDGGVSNCEEARRGNLFILVLIMRLLRSYFPRNDGGYVTEKRHDVAICLFLSFHS
jgi:hypothetical protein